MIKIDEKEYELACKAMREIELANDSWENLNFPGYFYHSGKAMYITLVGIAYDIKKAVRG
ncbi:MAG: hypothetical protein ACE5J7_03290 [Candidatus Aenigmatarchaeota archaeon]